MSGTDYTIDIASGDLVINTALPSGLYYLEIVLSSNGVDYPAVYEAVQIYDHLVSAKSVVINADELTDPPPAPQNILFSFREENLFDIYWDDVSNMETEFRIYLNDVLLDTTAGGVASYPDVSLAGHTEGVPSQATYEVAAANAFGESARVGAEIQILPPDQMPRIAGFTNSNDPSRLSPNTDILVAQGGNASVGSDQQRNLYLSSTNDLTDPLNLPAATVTNMTYGQTVAGRFDLERDLDGDPDIDQTYAPGTTWSYRVEVEIDDGDSVRYLFPPQQFTRRNRLYVSAPGNGPAVAGGEAGAVGAAGSLAAPLATVAGALAIDESGEEIRIAEGTYDEGEVTFDNNLTISGSWNPGFTAQSGTVNSYPANSSGTITARAENGTLRNIGFLIAEQGTLRYGLFINAAGPVAIESAAFSDNGPDVGDPGTIMVGLGLNDAATVTVAGSTFTFPDATTGTAPDEFYGIRLLENYTGSLTVGGATEALGNSFVTSVTGTNINANIRAVGVGSVSGAGSYGDLGFENNTFGSAVGFVANGSGVFSGGIEIAKNTGSLTAVRNDFTVGGSPDSGGISVGGTSHTAGSATIGAEGSGNRFYTLAPVIDNGIEVRAVDLGNSAVATFVRGNLFGVNPSDQIRALQPGDGGSASMVFAGTGADQVLTIESNRIYAPSYNGSSTTRFALQIQNASQLTIRGNQVFVTPGSGGNGQFFGIDVAGNNHINTIFIEENTIELASGDESTALTGVRLRHQTAAAEVQNNVLHSFGNTSLTIGSRDFIQIGTVAVDSFIDFNTMVNTNPNAGTTFVTDLTGTPNNNYIRGNIFQSIFSDEVDTAISVTAAAGGNVQGNLFGNFDRFNSPDIVYTDGAGTLDDAEVADTVFPNFTDNRTGLALLDPTPDGSPFDPTNESPFILRDLATDLLGEPRIPTTDIAGTARGSNLTPGAYEYDPSFTSNFATGRIAWWGTVEAAPATDTVGGDDNLVGAGGGPPPNTTGTNAPMAGMRFDQNADHRYETPNDGPVSTLDFRQPFTIGFWMANGNRTLPYVNRQGNPLGGEIISRGPAATPNLALRAVPSADAGIDDLIVIVDSYDLRFSQPAVDTYGESSMSYYTLVLDPPAGALTVYANNLPIAHVTDNAQIQALNVTPGTNLRFGGSGVENAANVMLADIQFWNRALNPREIVEARP